MPRCPWKARVFGLILVALLVPVAPAHAATRSRIVVKVKAGALHAAATGTGGQLRRAVSNDTYALDIPQTAARALAELRSRSDVLWAEPDTTMSAALSPNDTCYISACHGLTQWNAQKIGAPTAWNVSHGEQAVKIAVIDSGVDSSHPDLQGRVTVSPNFASDDPNNFDDNGHGTHVAGIAAATGNNALGLAGISWESSIMSVKVLDQGSGPGGEATGWISDIAAGIRWAADNGARVENLSLAGSNSSVLAEAVVYAQSRGVLVVAAAGNDQSTTPVYPANLPDVLSVGASDQSDALAASFSNRGRWVDILAPGTGIVSTWPTNLDPVDSYRSLDGTSMATPLVAGTAALLWSASPYLSANGVANRLMATAKNISGSGTFVASGRLDAGAALSGLPTGYRFAATDGGVFSFGASYEGSAAGLALARPVVAMASTGTSAGYWLVVSDGGVFSFGDAGYSGSTGAIHLNQPIVAATASRGGKGYWLVASDGGVFSFGDARFYGSTGAIHLNQPIVAIVPTVTGAGYWLVASDGGVFSFGDAQFRGSTGDLHLNRPIVAAGRTHSGAGYWLVASDGGVFSFGDARFYGSTGAIHLNQPIVSMTPTATGEGYWLVASDGGVFSFGDARFYGSTGSIHLNRSIVAATGF